MAVHCYINDTDSTIYASLSSSRALLDFGDAVGPIDGGVVSLYQDDEKLFDFEPAELNGFNNYVYRGAEAFGIKAGDIELRASAPGYPEISAMQTFPVPIVPITDIDFEQQNFLTEDGNVYDKIEITFDDPPNVENFYEVSVVSYGFSNTCVFGNNLGDAEYRVISNDIHTNQSANNLSILLSDEGFDGQTYNLILGAENVQNNGRGMQVIWKSITKDQYNYSKSLFDFSTSSEFGSFATGPISIFSNIDNGLGVFGCATQKIYELSDFKAFPNNKVDIDILNSENFESCLTTGLLNINTSIVIIRASADGEIDFGRSQIRIRIDKPNVVTTNGNILFARSITGQGGENFRDNLAEFTITDFDEDNNILKGTYSGTLTNIDNITNTVEFNLLEFEVHYEDR